MPQIIVINLIFPRVFAVNARYSYGKIKADDEWTLTSTILITFQFDVKGIPTDRGSFLGDNRGSQIEKIQLNQTIIIMSRSW